MTRTIGGPSAALLKSLNARPMTMVHRRPLEKNNNATWGYAAVETLKNGVAPCDIVFQGKMNAGNAMQTENQWH
jgi:hypothetical protein